MTTHAPVFFYDYVDPLSWVMERRVSDVEADLGLDVERRPLELRPPPAPLVDPDDPAWRRYWEQAHRALEEEGLTLAAPALVPWTRKAHELVVHAREHDRGAAVHRALFRAFLEEGRDIGRVDVLSGIAGAHDLPWTETRAVLDVDKHAGTVAEGRELAERLGIRGVPTVLDGERTLEGLHDRAALRAFFDGR